jgi:hypothetical protein
VVKNVVLVFTRDPPKGIFNTDKSAPCCSEQQKGTLALKGEKLARREMV